LKFTIRGCEIQTKAKLLKTYKTHYKREGLSEVVLRHTDIRKGKWRIYTYQMEIRLNPKRLIEKENDIKIIQEFDLPQKLPITIQTNGKT
jgi:hypothetical protein